MKAKRDLFQICLLAVLLPMSVARADQYSDFTYTSDGTHVTINRYTGLSNNVIIPDTIIGLPVNNIGVGAFYECGNLNHVTIPDGVTNLGYNAFSECRNLNEALIPNSVVGIDNYAFDDCLSMTNLIIGNHVINLGINAFYGCTKLTSILIPDSISNMGGRGVFSFCTGLTNVIIGKNVTNIDGAFFRCYSLTGLFFEGNAPNGFNGNLFYSTNNAIVYFLPNTTGWENFAQFTGGLPVAPWLPQAQIIGSGSGTQTNQFSFNINWADGQTVMVEACTDLSNPVWQPVQTNILTSDTAYFSDPQWTNYPGRFYRLRSP